MADLRLNHVRTDGRRVTYDYEFDGPLRRFFSRTPFFAEYDVDVGDVPDAVLAVPWLANVCPVAWAVGADVAVPQLDREFGAALDRVRDAMCEMYPEFMDGGAVRGESVSPEPDRAFDGSAVLFSGGVDSLTTYVRHREEDPTLVTIDGADIAHTNREAWRRNRAIVETFAGERGLETAFVTTDMHGFLDGQQLRAHYQRYIDLTWWAAVQHGLGLLGLTAPVAYARGVSDVYIASTHTEAFDEPWGSHPKIDDEVAWTGTQARHDGYELSRERKLELLVDYAEREAPELTIRSCHESAGGGNCGRCEKCARTIVGLLLVGADPAAYGYSAEPGVFERFREQLADGDWELGVHKRFMWKNLQADVDPERDYPRSEAEAFLRWLTSVDVDELAARSSEPRYKPYVRSVARNVPYPVFRTLLPVYTRLQGRG